MNMAISCEAHIDYQKSDVSISKSNSYSIPSIRRISHMYCAQYAIIVEYARDNNLAD